MRIKSLIPWRNDHRDEELPRFGPMDDVFHSLQNEMNQLFDAFSYGTWNLLPLKHNGGTHGQVIPHIDVAETDTEILVTAELPGMDEKDVEISLSGDLLTIKGEKKAEKETRKKDFYRMERGYGTFCRNIPLPAELELDKAEATFKKGVLSVRLPKSAKAVRETRKIEVKAE